MPSILHQKSQARQIGSVRFRHKHRACNFRESSCSLAAMLQPAYSRQHQAGQICPGADPMLKSQLRHQDCIDNFYWFADSVGSPGWDASQVLPDAQCSLASLSSGARQIAQQSTVFLSSCSLASLLQPSKCTSTKLARFVPGWTRC